MFLLKPLKKISVEWVKKYLDNERNKKNNKKIINNCLLIKNYFCYFTLLFKAGIT